MARYLLFIDLDQLQRYIFATHRLREIRNASIIVSKANAELEGKLGELIRRFDETATVTWSMSTAGVMKAIVEGAFEDAQLNEIVEKLCLHMTNATEDVTATGCWLPLEGSNFGATLTAGEEKLRAKKDSRDWLPWLPSHPLFRLCDLCGQNAATEQYKAPGKDDKELLCPVCIKKARGFETQPDTEDKDSGTPIETITKSVHNAFKLYLTKPEQGMDRNILVKRPRDFKGLVKRLEWGELADGSRETSEQGYMAMLYADGNNMGVMWRKFSEAGGSEKQYEILSKAITDATMKALEVAVLEVAKDEKRFEDEKSRQENNIKNGKWIMPFLPLMVGGDDIVCIVPGSWAFEVANKMAAKFQAKLAECDVFTTLGLDVPGLSVGVAIIKASFPIQQAFMLSEDLLKTAKGRVREQTVDQDPGGVDFAMHIQTSLSTVKETRETHYKVDGVILTERPYLVGDTGKTALKLQALIDAANVLKDANGEDGVPRSKWKDLPEILRLTVHRDETYKEWVAGLRDKQRKTWRDALQMLGIDDGNWCRETDTGKSTGILDLVEILDVISQG